jgi:hypothetical protein
LGPAVLAERQPLWRYILKRRQRTSPACQLLSS